jgi:glycosyltransferase involved in cell wall biosynthesis
MDRPLRFCMITSFYPPYNYGGDGVYVHGLSNALAERGHEVHVIHCIDAYRAFADEDPTEPYHDHPNVTVHALKSRFGLLSPLLTHQTGFPVFKAHKIQRILDQGFDVIHYHTISLVGGPAILQYGQGIKLYSTHDHWLVCPTRVLFRFNRAVCTRRHCFLCSLTHKRPPQMWRYTSLVKNAVKHVDALVIGSRFTMEKHKELGIDAPMVHLPYFVRSEAGSPTASPAAVDIPEGPYFLFAGRLMKIKGVQTLIPIFRRYEKAALLVAGTGRYEARLHQLARGSDNIRFLGHMPYGQLRRLYRSAVAVIVPSITFEVATLVSNEASSEGAPVIVRNLGGMPELVEGGGGLVYDTDEGLLAAMDQLVENPALRSELGQRGFQTYLRQWTVEAHLNKYLKLIEDIASARRLPTDH